ncbi:MAG: hypothetical protein QOI98_3615, partial [Solirubrobacteraceae bacterium]|nr:hypothetical protein [Solirubrobacteraceae bacterium]
DAGFIADLATALDDVGASALTRSTRLLHRIERALDTLSVRGRTSRFGYPFVTQTHGNRR